MSKAPTVPTIDERFDRLEERLAEQGQQIAEQGRQIAEQGKRFDKRLTEFDERLTKQGERFEAQLDHIAAIVIKGFDRIDHELEKKADKDDIQRVMDFLDSVAKRQEVSDEERLVMGHQLDRLSRWVKDLADKIGYELTY